MTTLDRFWRYVEPEPNSGCWLWIGTRDHHDYGVFWNGEKTVRAHRFAYEHFRAPIPTGLGIDHRCRVTSCVNPQHLDPCTQRENVLRGIGLTAENARKEVCPQGHSYEVFGYIRPSGRRQCQACHLERNREYKRRIRHPEWFR